MSDIYIQYKELGDTISFEGFEFNNHIDGENNILKPRLEEAGFHNVRFYDGERDSFGPLSRVCYATDEQEKIHHFIYG